MKIWDAIRKMREMTAAGQPFAFTFMSYNSTSGTSEGVVYVKRAKLRKKADARTYRYADALMPYQDIDLGEPRQFYIPCLMSFNGIKVTMR